MIRDVGTSYQVVAEPWRTRGYNSVG